MATPYYIYKKRLHTLAAIAVMVLASHSVSAQKVLTVLHTNDTHSCITPQNKNLADTMIADRGGFVRRLALIEEQRKEDPDLLYFDSGDFSQGSPFYTMFKGEVEVGLMNIMGVDAVAMGNHEFDFGMDNLAYLARKATFPILCSNYDFSGTPAEGLIRPYTIIHRKGIKIGVFALSPKLEGLVSAKSCEGVTFIDPVAKAQEMVALLRDKEKCDMVILLSHLGWNVDEYSDQYVIARTKGIDLVLGGHSHTYFDTLKYVKDMEGKNVPVDQNGKNAVYIGKMKLTLNKGK